MVATTLNGAQAKTVNPMTGLYKRLHDAGFDKKFVRQFALPEWWDDSLAENATELAILEVRLARLLGITIEALRNTNAPLRQLNPNVVRLKRVRGTTFQSMAPAIMVAHAAARQVAAFLTDMPSFEPVDDPLAIREEILERHQSVSLRGLVEFAWSHGVVVLHVRNVPADSHKFTGLAFFCDETPIVVLGKSTDSPPWLAFHLAHELGHIMLGHVQPNGELFLDAEEADVAGTESDDQEEADADAFALTVLTGNPRYRTPTRAKLTAVDLTVYARYYAPAERVDEGTYVLCHGWLHHRMPVAQKSLRLLGQNSGAHAILTAELLQRLADERSDSLDAALALLDVVPA